MGVVDTLKSNAEKRMNNVKGVASREVDAAKKMVDDLTDLEVVEGPFDFLNNSIDNVGQTLKDSASANKQLFDGLERDVSGGEFALGEKLKKKIGR